MKTLTFFFVSLLVRVCFSVDIDPKEDTDGKIVGGEDIPLKQAPYQISLQARRNEGNQSAHFCGGSIIHSRVILTAAHCTFSHSPRKLLIRVGAAFKKVGGKFFNVTKIVNHYKYSKNSFRYDIALVQIDKPIAIEAGVQEIIEIAEPDYKLRDGAKAFATGWGETQGNVTKGMPIRGVYLPVINQKKCMEIDSAIADDMLCAGYMEGGKATCVGDSGGPLTFTTKDKVRKLVGITSYGRGSYCGFPKFPPVFTRVSSFSLWIKEQLKILLDGRAD